MVAIVMVMVLVLAIVLAMPVLVVVVKTVIVMEQKASLITVRGIGGTVNSKSAGILLSHVRAPLPLCWLDGGSGRLRSSR
ncbi:hypothetical protein PoB_000307700 [Plakobranchus ocellatus]|uniref:Uncharacterized protein n=1 Tax=Plakobranchus ocellatus TaxID=259542 RepID=A0AAV3Y2C2_9GAST|nr:hypothetical protein PoB_000307700 [Plakobranchus ocellatus]